MKIGVLFFHTHPLYNLYICFLGVLNFIFTMILYSPWACKESDMTERPSMHTLAKDKLYTSKGRIKEHQKVSGLKISLHQGKLMGTTCPPRELYEHMSNGYLPVS